MKLILLGEDEQDIAEIYKMALEQAGFKVIIAEDGDIVITRAIMERPDLLLLDINMPNKNGFQVLDEAVNNLELYEALRKTPIIMLTNYSNPQDIEYCVKRGVQDYMIKTEWKPEQIVEKVKNFLEGKD